MPVLLNPALFAFAVLAAVPVLAHLFAKARPKERPFPSLQWLRQVERKTTRLRRPRDRILLALRTLAVGALVLAFLQPLWFRGTPMTPAGARKTVVIVLDRTASMSYVENGQSRLARGAAVANDVLKGSGSGTLANVVWLAALPRTAFPEPGVNTEALREWVRRVDPTYEDGDVREAIRLAIEQLGMGEGTKELYLVSDFQSTAWKDAVSGVPPSIRVFTLGTAAGEAANTALASLMVEPERPVAGTDARVVCRVRNFAPSETKTTVQLAFGPVRQSRPLTVPAWGEGVAEFRVPCGGAGVHSVAAILPEDAFPADDRRFAAVEVRENWRAAVIGPASDGSVALWQKALAAIGWIETTAAADDADVIVAVREAPALAADLRRAAERGAIVICQPDARWSGAAWAGVWGGEAGTAAVAEDARDRRRDSPWTMETAQDRHPIWQVFASGEHGDPAGGGVWRRVRFPAEPDSVLLRFDDGVPAVAARRLGQGWVIAWNIELDEAVSEWVQQPAFLVFVGELLLHHAAATGDPVPRSFGPAQRVTWQPDQAARADQFRLEDDSGAAHPFEMDSTLTPPAFRSASPLPPGMYKWVGDGQTAERAAVNFPSDAESDLRCLDPGAVGVGESLSARAAASLVARRDGFPLWPWCVGACALLLLLEGAAARVKPTEVPS